MRSGRATSLLRGKTLSVAVVLALVLVWLSPDARGATTPGFDEDQQGAPYAAGELLVTYEPGASGRRIDEIVEWSAARVEGKVSVPNAQLLSFPAVKREQRGHLREEKLRRAREALQRVPGVRHVDYNYLRLPYYAANDPAFVDGFQWDLPRIGAPAAWNRTVGVGSRIAIVDTGIDGDHPDLDGKIVAQRDMVDNDVVAEDDRAGHGTHVAGTVGAETNNGAGVAAVCPACKLLVAKSGDSRVLYDSDIVQGIYWSVNNRAKAINLSLGSQGNSRILEHAVNYAWGHGVVVVAAAGNENTGRPSYPAAYRNVISVSATDLQNRRARFSNYGKIDVAAPGVRILSTVPGGGYDIKAGTSMASPHVAALAGLLAAQGRSAPEIRRRIQSTATDLGAEGKDRLFGWGLINANRAVGR